MFFGLAGQALKQEALPVAMLVDVQAFVGELGASQGRGNADGLAVAGRAFDPLAAAA